MANFKTQLEHYLTHGYAIFENFLTPDELARSWQELSQMRPGWFEYIQNPQYPKPTDWGEPP